MKGNSPPGVLALTNYIIHVTAGKCKRQPDEFSSVGRSGFLSKILPALLFLQYKRGCKRCYQCFRSWKWRLHRGKPLCLLTGANQEQRSLAAGCLACFLNSGGARSCGKTLPVVLPQQNPRENNILGGFVEYCCGDPSGIRTPDTLIKSQAENPAKPGKTRPFSWI